MTDLIDTSHTWQDSRSCESCCRYRHSPHQQSRVPNLPRVCDNLLTCECAEMGGSAAGKAGAIVGAFGFGEMVLTAGIPVTLGVLAITNFLGEPEFTHPTSTVSQSAILSLRVSLVTECWHANMYNSER